MRSVRQNRRETEPATLTSGRKRAVPTSGRRHAIPLFAIYAAASLVPVVALGAVLAITYRADTNKSAMAEARSQASLLADDIVGPTLGTKPLEGSIPPSAATAIAAAFRRASEISSSMAGTIARQSAARQLGDVIESPITRVVVIPEAWAINHPASWRHK